MLKPYLHEHLVEAGCDEAGRGCLAGPVFAAAVILPKDFAHPLLNDSKQLSEKQRFAARQVVEQAALAWAVAQVSPEEIDKINILNASFLAMHRAIDQLDPVPESLLIDGNRFSPYRDLPFHCIIKGDAKMLSIAAASIIAKTYRDDCMMQLGAEGIFVGSGIFKSGDPVKRANAIVQATTHYDNPDVIAKVSRGLGEAMVGINLDELSPEQRYAGRGW